MEGCLLGDVVMDGQFDGIELGFPDTDGHSDGIELGPEVGSCTLFAGFDGIAFGLAVGLAVGFAITGIGF